MDREKYLKSLIGKSKVCNCSSLSDLLKIRKEAEDLEKRCAYFNGELNLENPKQEDLDGLLDYRSASIKLDESVKKYSNKTSSLLMKGF